MSRTYEFMQPVRAAGQLIDVDFTVLDKDEKPMQWAGMVPSVEVYEKGNCDGTAVFTLSGTEITLTTGNMAWKKDINLLDPAPSVGEYDLHFFITKGGNKVLRAKTILIIEKC